MHIAQYMHHDNNTQCTYKMDNYLQLFTHNDGNLRLLNDRYGIEPLVQIHPCDQNVKRHKKHF